MVSDSRCSVCGGGPEEHGPGKTQHAFATDSGQLRTHEEAARAANPGAARVVVGGDQALGAVTRLVDVLLESGTITEAEGLYVLVGRPPRRPTKTFREPPR